MTEVKDAFVEILKRDGSRVTKARQAVFDQLYNQEPLSINELIKRTREVDRASIYRTVELFENLGIAQKVHLGWKYKIELTDKFSMHHHHLSCLRCGKTVSIDQKELEKFIDELARQHNFKATAHQIELQGCCLKCQSQIERNA